MIKTLNTRAVAIQEDAAARFPETDLQTGFSPNGVLAGTTDVVDYMSGPYRGRTCGPLMRGVLGVAKKLSLLR